jgi:hypothetical protein
MAVLADILSDLHSRKQAAIDSLDFETAQSLFGEIHARISEATLASIASIRASAASELSREQIAYRNQIESLAEERRSDDARLFSQSQVLFEQTRNDHINQLIELERERGITLLSEAEREIPEQILMLERAKQEAIDANFETAIALRQQARDIGQAELERRRAEVESDFEGRRNELLARQKRELDEISERHELELRRIRASDAQRVAAADDEFRWRMACLVRESEVQILSLRGENELKNQGVQDLRAEWESAMEEFREVPLVRPRLARSEVMRLTTLCPTNAVKNAMPQEEPLPVLQRMQAQTAKPLVPRMSGRPVSMSSTALLTRAYTAVGSRYRTQKSASQTWK